MSKFGFYWLAILISFAALTVGLFELADSLSKQKMGETVSNPSKKNKLVLEGEVNTFRRFSASAAGSQQETKINPLDLSGAVAKHLTDASPNSNTGSANSSSSTSISSSKNEQRFRDKLKGMLLLGAYGDALGVPHELGGGALDGKVGNPEKVQFLQPFITYRVGVASPWGVWIIPAANQLGVPTDDTSYRVMILHQWVREMSMEPTILEPSEVRFLEWLQQRTPPQRYAPQWQKIRYAFIQALIKGINGAKNGEIVEPFFFPDEPVVFGPFLYLELASIYASYPKEKVFETFYDFTVLDNRYGKFVTGMLAAMLADAVSVPREKKKRFDIWFFETASCILESNLGDVGHRETVREHFDVAKQIGITNRTLDISAFLQVVKQQVFLKTLPTENHRNRNYDPLLFIRMMAAAVGYSNGNVKKTLQVLAIAPGDADTMASQLGSIMGAYYGEAALRQPAIGISSDLTQVRNCILEQFGEDIYAAPNNLIRIAEKNVGVTRFKSRDKKAAKKSVGFWGRIDSK